MNKTSFSLGTRGGSWEGGEWEGVVATDWAVFKTDVYSLYWLCREGSVLILESSTFVRNRTESLKESALEGLGNRFL